MSRPHAALLPFACILSTGCLWIEPPVPVDDSGPGPDTESPDDTGPETGDPPDTGDSGTSDCDELSQVWDETWIALEDEVLTLSNAVRAIGADCGTYGLMPPVGPVAMEPHLRCAARVHALDMGTRDYFDHDSTGGPLGDTFDQRIHNAGYVGHTMGENIAAGYPSAQAVVDAWVESDGHCANLMSEAFADIGIGYAMVPGSTYVSYWVQDYGG